MEEDFVSDDPVAVAADIATANGFTPAGSAREEPTRHSFRRTTLIGAGLGALAAWVVLFNGPYLLPFNTIASWVILYACVLACPLAGPAIAIRRRFPHEPEVARLQVLAVSGVLVGLILAAVPCWALARLLLPHDIRSGPPRSASGLGHLRTHRRRRLANRLGGAHRYPGLTSRAMDTCEGSR